MSKPPTYTFSPNTKIQSAQMNQNLTDVSTNVLGSGTATADQLGITTTVDLTGLTATVTVPAGGHMVRISGHLVLRQLTSSGQIDLAIYEDATVLNDWRFDAAAGNHVTANPLVITTPAAGVHTYKFTLQTSAGTVGLLATASDFNPYLLVEVL